MKENEIESWLDIAPAYLDFSLKFLRNPAQAFGDLRGAAKISSDLTSVLLGGIAFSYLIVALFASPTLEHDPSVLLAFLRGLDVKLLPVAALMAVMLIAIVVHVSAKLFSFLDGLSKRPNWMTARLGGSVEDSANAALGFAAVYIPIVTAVICLTAWLPKRLGLPVGITLSLLLGLFPFVYFSRALSATHPNTTPGQGFFAVAVGYGLPVLLANWIAEQVQKFVA